jgi:DNA-binding GntR family transcriptional regulator
MGWTGKRPSHFQLNRASGAPAPVRVMILDGQLAPGGPIPQAAQARSLNVSRAPLREAFRLLEEEGLIENRPDPRVVVRSNQPPGDGHGVHARE